MKIYKEKQLLNDSKMFIYTLIPFIIGYYFTCLLGLWMEIVENDLYVITLAMIGVLTFTILLVLLFGYPYLLFELLIRKTIIFESDEIIVKSLLGSKRIAYYGITSCAVERYGIEEARITISYNGQEYKFKVRHMPAMQQFIDEMKLYFPVKMK